MRRFILITDGALIQGVEMEHDGSIALDWYDEFGFEGQYSVSCQSYQSLRHMRNYYTKAPLLWLDADHRDITPEQEQRAEEIRRHWIANGYTSEQLEYESPVQDKTQGSEKTT